MREEDIDIVEIMIKQMPEKTEIQKRIKLYMQTHKSNCNNYIYQKYEREAIFFNTILKSLTADLGKEIVTAILKWAWKNINENLALI